MGTEALYFFDPDERKYRFNDHHPFDQTRLLLTRDLLIAAGALTDAAIVPHAPAADDDVLAVHTAEFVEAVKALSTLRPDNSWVARSGGFGLDTEDTPFFPGMHEAAALIAGGSIAAAEAVMSGQSRHAAHLGGGLHHAFSNKAAGFCVYNDASIAIARIRSRYQARVLYVDTDVHHGDGVQMSFYSDPHVATLSIHETGKYLFPGTGFVEERGHGDGFGASINIPVEPYTEDESWLDCFEAVLEKAVARFRPDVIVSQHGCDAHYFDPLSHIHCSMDIYLEMPRILHRTAHAFCDGRWVALGGGGYDIWRVVPRAWSLLWMAMTDHPIPGRLESEPGLTLPPAWRDKWQPHAPVALPHKWLDEKGSWETIPRREEIAAKNRHTKQLAMLYL